MSIDLARIQFAITANTHFLFVVLTLGLAPLVAVMQTRYVVTGHEIHARMTKFWGQIYVVNYALGIVTGLVMEFQFGLDWTGLTHVAGQVFGAPLTLETVVAFFAEATFLGMWIFGWERLPRWLHLTLFWLVTLTAYASAYAIMVANGFLQHPVGYALSGGIARLTDMDALLTNPGALDAVQHIVPAALMTGGTVVAGISAWHLRRDTGEREFFLRSLRLGVVVMAAAGYLTLHFGFAQFDYLKVDQPLKWFTINTDPAQLAQAQAHMVAVHGPGNYAPPDWLGAVFLVMQTIGFAWLLPALLLPLLVREWIVRRRLVLRVLTWVIPVPFVAVICGWLVREVGRQPWVIYGVLRTRDAGAGLDAGMVAFSLTAFGCVFAALAVTDWWLIARLARRGPSGIVLGTTLGDAEAAQPALLGRG